MFPSVVPTSSLHVLYQKPSTPPSSKKHDCVRVRLIFLLVMLLALLTLLLGTGSRSVDALRCNSIAKLLAIAKAAMPLIFPERLRIMEPPVLALYITSESAASTELCVVMEDRTDVLVSVRRMPQGAFTGEQLESKHGGLGL